MGTKVQHTSYLPGFYAMRDLNEEAEGCWSQYYEDNTSGRNLYNGYQLRPTNRYSEYDKEMLKRTMLEHEAIFRKQVHHSQPLSIFLKQDYVVENIGCYFQFIASCLEVSSLNANILVMLLMVKSHDA